MDHGAAQQHRQCEERCWLGFGALSPSVLAHPNPDMGGLDVATQRLEVADELIIMVGQTVRNEGSMRRLAQASWNLDEIDERYANFVERFRPLFAAYGKDANVSLKSAFLVRTLLIQEYRKVLLRMETADGPLPPPAATFGKRFGGLD